MAGTIGLVQNDIKRVLAYSTVSQLGYMFLAMGVGAYAAGIFHLYTHAFFKALLFLGSGAVIHALAGEQDLRHMGGLKKELPITYWTFLIGALAIAGVPPLAGFFSKDEILFRTFAGRPHVLWVVGAADVAADRDLHVPPRVPGVPRRAPPRTPSTEAHPAAHGARPRTSHTPHGTRPRRSHGHGMAMASPRRAAGDGASRSSCWRSDRSSPATSACRTRSAAATGSRRSSSRASRAREPRPPIRVSSACRRNRARGGRSRTTARRAPSESTELDADGASRRRRGRRHRHRARTSC